MKILHTSDWHLGAKLNEYHRFDEHLFFLEQLVKIIVKEHIELLLISGDIFDSSSPSSRAQKLYFDFLNDICQYHTKVVITAGNHDSVTLLEAPKNLLRDQLEITIVGKITVGQPANQLIYIKDQSNLPVVAIGAVPYIREQDLKLNYSSSNYEIRQEELAKASINYYNNLIHHKMSEYSSLPLVLMGHLTAKGNIFTSDEFLGGLSALDLSLIDRNYNFFALGHIHSYQGVPGVKNCYYCGSPVAISFSEYKEKKVIIYDSVTNYIEAYPIQTLKKLIEISGSEDEVIKSIKQLKNRDDSYLVKINHQSNSLYQDIKLQLSELVEDSNVAIAIQSSKIALDQGLEPQERGEKLSTLNEFQIFQRLLQQEELTDEEIKELTTLYHKVVDALYLEDEEIE